MIDSFDLEFHAIFNRVSAIVNLKGAYGVNEVNQRVEDVMYYLEGKEALMKERGQKPPKRLLFNRKQLEKLLRRNRFADRVTSELVANPNGVVSLTVRYGRERAKQILLRRARERRGRLRRVTPRGKYRRR